MKSNKGVIRRPLDSAFTHAGTKDATVRQTVVADSSTTCSACLLGASCVREDKAGGFPNRRLRCCFTMGKIRGTLCMRRHILALPATTKFLDKSFVFKKSVAEKGLPKVASTGLGAGGPGSNPGPRPKYLLSFQTIKQTLVHPKFTVEK